MVITMEKITSDFLSIKTYEDLIKIFKLNGKTLNYYISESVCNKSYTSFTIKKKNGGERIIEAPCKQLKYIQKTLATILQDIYIPKKSVHGYVKKHSIITNSEVHVNKRIVINIDIKDFFSSIHFGRVMGLFQKEPFNFSKEIAKMLARLVCYKGRLPQGAPSSPIISNFIARGLDNDLIKLTSQNKLLYTRYCDDITISSKSNKLFTNILTSEGKLGKDIEEIFKKHSFIINPDKTSVKYQKNRQMVTGLVVNQKVNILNKKYRKTRNIFYYTWLHGIEAGAIKNSFQKSDGSVDKIKFLKFLRGTVEYYKMVLGIYSSKYQLIANYYNEITTEKAFLIPETFDTMINNYVFVTELIKNQSKESSQIYQGTAFYCRGIGLVSCLHNFWDIIKPLDKKELDEDINRAKVFLPRSRTYSVKVKKVFFEQDIIILDVLYYNTQGGFELEESNTAFTSEKSFFTAVGYPEYSETSSSLSIIRNIQVEQPRNLRGQKICVIDKPLYTGASGGPVFDKNNKVVGVISRGNEYGKKEEHYNAFTPIKFLFEK